MPVTVDEEKLKAEMDHFTRTEWEKMSLDTRIGIMGAMSRMLSPKEATPYLIGGAIGFIGSKLLKL
jgi:hypothetical protein